MRNNCNKCGSFATKSYDKEKDICDVCYWKDKFNKLLKDYNTLKCCNNCAKEGSPQCTESCRRNEIIPVKRLGNKDLWINKFTTNKSCRTCGSDNCIGCVNLSKWRKRD